MCRKGPDIEISGPSATQIPPRLIMAATVIAAMVSIVRSSWQAVEALRTSCDAVAGTERPLIVGVWLAAFIPNQLVSARWPAPMSADTNTAGVEPERKCEFDEFGERLGLITFLDGNGWTNGCDRIILKWMEMDA